MKRGLDWYKREPAAIIDAIRAARMTTAQAAVYNLVLDLIYLTNGETPNDPRYIAAHFSDMGTAKASRAIDDLVAMGKLTVVGGMLIQKRAASEVHPRKNLSEIRADAGRLGGFRSGISRQKINENNETGEAIASSNSEPEKREIREEKKDVVVVVGAGEAKPLFRRVLEAVGLNPNGILPARWMPPAAEIEVNRFRDFGNGLTDDQIVAVAVESRKRHPDPPKGPKALETAMRHIAETLAAPPPRRVIDVAASIQAEARRLEAAQGDPAE